MSASTSSSRTDRALVDGAERALIEGAERTDGADRALMDGAARLLEGPSMAAAISASTSSSGSGGGCAGNVRLAGELRCGESRAERALFRAFDTRGPSMSIASDEPLPIHAGWSSSGCVGSSAISSSSSSTSPSASSLTGLATTTRTGLVSIRDKGDGRRRSENVG